MTTLEMTNIADNKLKYVMTELGIVPESVNAALSG